MNELLARAIALVEQRRVPDRLVRFAIRQLCRQRLRVETRRAPAERERDRAALIAALRQGPVAPVGDLASEQHYKLPVEFFARVLGPHLKSSCGYWMHGAGSLAEAEQASLAVTCQRAGLADGMDVLDLGCGWGSLTLWMAQHYPRSRITAVSTAGSQRDFIEGCARDRGLENVRAIAADFNTFEADGPFDRIVSIETFERMRNYEELMARIARWLRPDGELFVHVVSHRGVSYSLETEGAGNWVGRHFVSGGIIPSHDLLLEFQRDMELADRWHWNGRHYQRTANVWLANLDRAKADILPLLAGVYGRADTERWLVRWRLFLMAVAEQFGYRRGREWGVSLFLFRPRSR